MVAASDEERCSDSSQTPAVPMWGGGPGDPVAQGPHAIAFHGSSFCVSEPEGDVVPGRPQGYFRHDTRLLSRWGC